MHFIASVRHSLQLCAVLVLFCLPLVSKAQERPNILWITSEDNSPYLGCYGDPLARTPNLDRFASQGVRYRNAFANAPVCSTARTALITGMYANAIGAHHHRSRVRIPASFRLYPQYLRAAGYYCSNNSKTDYNLVGVESPWNESSNRAHYKKRPARTPFFAVFNLGSSHESQASARPAKEAGSFRVPPEKIALPPWHPDTLTIRRDWANYYDQIALMDQQAGALLDELDKEGLAEDTIVFYFSDHGGALPRGKRNIHDSGTRVPMIIRVPKKWAHMAPVQAGEWVDQPVSFIDLPPTLLSLAGAPIPSHFQGRPFLGHAHAQGAARDHVFLFRGRMDERYDTVRAIRDRQFRYVRNYDPHRPWGQHYSYPFQVLASMRSWHEEFEAGRCNPVQARYWQSKPSEELYDVIADPFEIHNLADDPAHATRLDQMRRALTTDMIAMRDAGLIPEAMAARLADTGTVYEYVQSADYPIERVVAIAGIAASKDLGGQTALIQAMRDPHPVIRYWGAQGCVIRGAQSASAREELEKLLGDEYIEIRMAAAEAVGGMGGSEAALQAVTEALRSSSEAELLAALNALEGIWTAGHVPLAEVHGVLKDLKFTETPARIANHLLSLRP